MLLVFAHTDFRIYWPARLARLSAWCLSRNIELRVVEIAGKGGLYGFAEGSHGAGHPWWHCLFPGRSIEEVSPREASSALYRELEELQPDVVFTP